MNESIIDVIQKNNPVSLNYKRKIKAKAKLKSSRLYTKKRRILACARKEENKDAQALAVFKQEDANVQAYKSLSSLKSIREYWTEIAQNKEGEKFDVDEGEIIRTMVSVMASDMDRYVKYAALEKGNKRRLNPSPDLTKLSENIMNYLKDLLQASRGFSLDGGDQNPRQFVLNQTLNIFQQLKPNERQEFQKIIDAATREPTKDSSQGRAEDA